MLFIGRKSQEQNIKSIGLWSAPIPPIYSENEKRAPLTATQVWTVRYDGSRESHRWRSFDDLNVMVGSHSPREFFVTVYHRQCCPVHYSNSLVCRIYSFWQMEVHDLRTYTHSHLIYRFTLFTQTSVFHVSDKVEKRRRQHSRFGYVRPWVNLCISKTLRTP